MSTTITKMPRILQEIQNKNVLKSKKTRPLQDDGLENEYSKDTIKAMLKKESSYCYDLRETEVSKKARCVLINWLIEIHESYSFKQQILHCTVSILDSYTMKGVVNHNNLQLVGVTSMFLSAKNIGALFPQVNDLIYITGSYFTKSDVLSMEMSILKTLEYDLNRPVTSEFLKRINESIAVPSLAINFARYFLDLSLFEPFLCSCPPSQVACAALNLGLHIQGDEENNWHEKFYSISSYRENEFKEQTTAIIKTLEELDHANYPAVKKKYDTAKYEFVSTNPIEQSRDLSSLKI